MNRRLTSLAALVAVGVLVFASARTAQAADGRVLNVPVDYPTVEAAIAASAAGDMILLAPGTYPGGIEVPADKPGITIRGMDRNTVIFDGADVRGNAIEVEADNVTLENMTAHSYTENGFYWDDVEGYAGRYLTVWNVGLYGIYAIQSHTGVIEDSYVSGAADAAFYIGECNPCDATIRNVTAVLSAVGYSGTNAGGNLVVETSRFEYNGIGILPNSFDVHLQPPPQRAAIFRNNEVIGSGTRPTPRNTPLAGYHGVGIGIAGGVGNLVANNDVSASARYGIAVFTSVDLQRNWVPGDNRIEGNHVATSGTADIALAAGSGAGNCFTDNKVTETLPAGLTGCSAADAGSDVVADELVLAPPDLLAGLPPAPDYTSMEAPGEQPSQPLALAPLPDSSTALVIGLIGIVVAAVGIAVVLNSRPKRSADPTNLGNYGLRLRGISLIVLGSIGIILAGLILVASGPT